MTLEQKEELEHMLNYYSRKAATCESKSKVKSAFIFEDRIRQIEEVLETLGYEVNKGGKELLNGIFYHVYTITDNPC